MFSWDDFINNFPYTNFSDINVSWFLNKFKQVFDEWEGLYNQMLSWKTATDEYNANWRQEQETAFQNWENNFQNAIDAWKAQTETNINTWEQNTIANLESWKNVFITEYNTLKAEVEQIALDAENAKNSAQASATSAQQSADSASATAESLSSSLTQITTNTANIEDLKTQLNGVSAVTVTEETDTITENIFPNIVWTNGYIDVKGALHESTVLRHSQKIAVNKDDVITYNQYDYQFRYITAYNGNNVISAESKDSSHDDTHEYTVTEGINYIIISDYISKGDAPIYRMRESTIYKNKLDPEIEEINTSITELDTRLENAESKIDSVTTTETYQDIDIENIYDSLTWTTGYMGLNGVTDIGSGTLRYSNKIPVNTGDIIKFENAEYTFNFITAFSDNTAEVEKGKQGKNSYIVPDGINYVVLTEYISRGNTPILHITITKIHTVTHIKTIPLGYMMEKGNMLPGDKLTLPYMQVKTYNRLVFNANITSFGSIRYNKDNVKIELDNTNLIVTPSGQATIEIPHTLTIGKNITLLIETETREYISKVTVCSDGDIFEYAPVDGIFAPSKDSAQNIESVNSELTECVFSWVSKTLNSKIWLFGDSYFQLYSNQGWTYYLAENGYSENVLLNGFAGQGCVTAYDALVNLLNVTVPKIVVWCQGMNNPDNSVPYENANAVNAIWLEYYNKVLNLEKEYGFELVLYTTPTTPKWKNNYKNNIIRNSQHRYVEIDKTMRINNNGDWITGTLNPDDDTHPTEKGAKIIYHRFLTDLPEMMCKF